MDHNLKRLNSFERKIYNSLEKINSKFAYGFLNHPHMYVISSAIEGHHACSTMDMPSDSEVYYDFGYWPKNCEQDRMKCVVKYFTEDDIGIDLLNKLPNKIKNIILANALLYGRWWETRPFPE